MSARLFVLGTKKLSIIRHAVTSFYALNPRLANACTGCVTFTLGDILAQKIQVRTEKDAQSLDYWRSLQVGALGLVMNGIFLHHWYNTLDKIVGSSMTSKFGVAMKVAADQFIYAPFAILTFFGFTSVREAGSVSSAKEEFKNKVQGNFTTTFLADCTLWPLSNFVNFRYVNLAYRPSFTAVVQLLWQTYLSLASHKREHIEVKKPQESMMSQESSAGRRVSDNTF